MPKVIFSVDQSKSMRDQAVPGHNRWHPDIPTAAMVRPGDEFRLECRDWTDAQIGNNDSANDVRDVDLSQAHMLSGPIGVEGAEPGDLLVVDILDLGPVPQQGRRRAGTGLGLHRHLRQGERRRLPDRLLPRRLQGDLGLPRHVRDLPSPARRPVHRHHPPRAVRHRAVGRSCWPEWNRREQALIDTDPDRVPPLGLPPLADNALAGTATGDLATDRRARGPAPCPRGRTAATTTSRTSPAGRRVFYPVLVEGRQALRRRPALQPGRRRDHLLRRHRDGRLHRLPRRPDQGRHGEVRCHHQPDLHAGQRRAALLGVPLVHRHLGRPRHRHQLLPRRDAGLPPGLPQRRRIPQEVGLHAASRPTCSSARRPSRGGSAGSSTSPTPAARSTCRRRSSTSTCVRTRRDPSRGPGAVRRDVLIGMIGLIGTVWAG